MAYEKFSIADALSYGWKSFTNNIGFFLVFIIVMGVVTIVPDVVIDQVFAPKSVPFVASKLIVRLLGLVLGMVATKISLDIYDTGKPDLNRISDLTGVFLSYLVGKILYGLIVLVGVLPAVIAAVLLGQFITPFASLLALPLTFFGFVLAYMFLYVGYLVIDRQMGPIDALQESRTITNGSKIAIFLFSLVLLLLNLVGAICLLVGLLVTIPMSLMASVYVYRHLAPKAGAVPATTTVA